MPSSYLLPASSAAAFYRCPCFSFLSNASASSSLSSSSLSSSRPSLARFLLARRRSYVQIPPHERSFSRGRQYGRAFHSTIAASTSVQTVEDLPSKLAEIVKLFQIVPDPRAKYEQLLHYGRKLKPLPKEYQILENKVQGCVSQVWVRASMDEGKRVYFEAESDSMLTRGLAALLVEGLSGALAVEILKISPDFIQMLGLNQSLTPSRSNGFLNMLKLMQKKTLELAIEAESTTGPVTEKDAGIDGRSPGNKISEVKVLNDVKGTSPAVEIKSRKETIRQKIETMLNPVVLEVEDVSYQHAGHAGVQGGASETHFNLKIVSPIFDGKTLVKRHRLVYDALQEELQNGLHALSIVAKTPTEAEKL